MGKDRKTCLPARWLDQGKVPSEKGTTGSSQDSHFDRANCGLYEVLRLCGRIPQVCKSYNQAQGTDPRRCRTFALRKPSAHRNQRSKGAPNSQPCTKDCQ